MEVIKRDGRKEEYDISKIILVLQNANLSLDDVNMCSREDILKVSKSVDGVLHFKSNISTEQIQSIVETQLIKHGYVDLAKSYIIGCYENKVQYQMSKLDKSVLDIIAGENREVATENSNKNAQLISTQRDYIAGEVSKSLSKRFVFDKEAVDLHEKGIIHIHDMDYAIQPMLNCCLINLEDMFNNGTNINGVSIDTPKSLQTASTLTSQISAVVASANFGGQTINLGHLVPYVDVSRQKIKKQLTDNFKTLGIEISDDKVAKLVEEQLKQEIKSSVQTLNYQWNTMTSTNGQTAFISLFMYLNEKQDNLYQQDLALLIEEFLNQRLKGMKNRDGVYVSQTFPKLLYVLDETNHSKDKPFYYLTELSAMCTAKRMVPDYISEKIMHKYKVNSKGEGRVVAPMGCVDGDEVINYKYKDIYYVEGFKRLWDRVSTNNIIQQHGISEYVEVDDLFILDIDDKMTKVKKVIKNPDQANWYRIKFTHGRQLLATGDHPLPIIGKGRTFVEDIEVGDSVAISKTVIGNQHSSDVDKAWLHGLIICDSSYRDGINILLGLDEMDIAQKAVKVLQDIYPKQTVRIVEQRRGNKGNYLDVKVQGVGIVNICKDLNGLFGGYKKIDRCIPQYIMNSNEDVKYAFLGGMIDADGYIRKGTIQIGSTNKELALQQMYLMNSLGMDARVYMNKYNSKDKNKIRYRVEAKINDRVLQYINSNKKLNSSTTPYNNISYQDAQVATIEFLGDMNKCSYDVETESDTFVVSGIHSHNCRSMLSVLDDNPDYLWGRANLGVCTINLPYIALQSNGDINEFWRFLDKYAKVIRRVQNTRYKKLLNVTSDISPTLWQYGVLARFKKGEKIAPYLTKDHCTISFGYAGLSEAVKYLTGMSHTDKSAHKFALSILQKLNDYCEQWKEEDNLGWSPYGTPRF